MKNIKKYLSNAKILAFQGWFGITNPFGDPKFGTVGGTVDKIVFALNTAIAFAAVVAVGYIVYGGYLMITSAGDSEKVETGQSSITNGIIGLVIIFLSGAAIRFLVAELL